MSKTRLAVVGLGQVTRNIHLPAYSQLTEQVEIVGGCDVNAPAREQALQRGVKIVFETMEEMLAKMRPDIVSICTPPFLHREQCLTALDANCHIFCEKPFAESLTDADDVISAAEKCGRVVVVNNQFPRMKIYQAAKAQIGKPDFGRLVHLHATQQFRPTAQTEAGWRGEMQRRLCFEFGIHVFELIRFFFDEIPVKVFAHIPPPLPGSNSDAINVISVEFADGRAASIVLDRLSKGPESYLDIRLDGENAAIHTSIGGQAKVEFGLFTREKRPFFQFHFVQGAKAVWQDGNRSRTLATDGINPFASSTAEQLRQMIRAIETGTEPLTSARDNRNTLALVFAAYDSAHRERAVAIAPYLTPSETTLKTDASLSGKGC